MLPLQGAQVQSLVELRFLHAARHGQKQKPKNSREKTHEVHEETRKHGPKDQNRSPETNRDL